MTLLFDDLLDEIAKKRAMKSTIRHLEPHSVTILRKIISTHVCVSGSNDKHTDY